MHYLWSTRGRQTDRESKKQTNNGIWLCPFGAIAPPNRMEGSSPSRVLTSVISLCLSISSLLPQPQSWDFSGHKRREKKERKTQGISPPQFLWVLVVPVSKNSTLSQNMCSNHSAHFQVLLCWVQARKYKRKKSSEVTTSSVVLGLLVFFPDPPADRYFKQFSSSCSYILYRFYSCMWWTERLVC